MSEMIFLGAGASVEAGIPDAYNMTKEIVKQFLYPQHKRVANFVVGGLLFKEGDKGNNPLESGINVEDFFNAVQLLAERNTLEAAPFIGSWHSKIDEFDKIDPYYINIKDLLEEISDSLKREITDALSIKPQYKPNQDVGSCINNWSHQITKKLRSSKPKSSHRLERGFKDAVNKSQPRPGGGRIFQQTAEIMIHNLKEISWIEDPERVRYLNPLINVAKNRNKLVIATLNYDNSIELAAKSQGISCNIGLDNWSRNGMFNTSENCLHLLKLHGSIDWERIENYNSDVCPFPHTLIKQVSSDQLGKTDFMPAVIFGQRNKLTTEGPFLDLLRAFKQELIQSEILTVVGYSFGDDHVNTYITQWLNQNEAHCIRIIDPAFSHNSKNYVEMLKRMRDKRSNQIEILNKKASEGLIQLYGSTE